MYESAHLISSRTTTEFTEFPMRDEVPTTRATASCSATSATSPTRFDLREHFRFGTEVTSVEPIDGDGRRDGGA